MNTGAYFYHLDGTNFEVGTRLWGWNGDACFNLVPEDTYTTDDEEAEVEFTVVHENVGGETVSLIDAIL